MTKKYLIKLIVLNLIVFFLVACSSQEESTSAVAVTLSPELIKEGLSSSTRVIVTPESLSSTPHSSPTIITESDSTPTISPTPKQNIYQTPTQLPKPHIIDILDWEMVIAISASICHDCGTSVTTVKAPRGLSIALIQISATGDIGSSSVITSTLAYGNKANCTISEKTNFCAFIFGQVSLGEITLSAHHVRGGQQQLKYQVTFQEWAVNQP